MLFPFYSFSIDGLITIRVTFGFFFPQSNCERDVFEEMKAAKDEGSLDSILVRYLVTGQSILNEPVYLLFHLLRIRLVSLLFFKPYSFELYLSVCLSIHPSIHLTVFPSHLYLSYIYYIGVILGCEFLENVLLNVHSNL